MHEIKNDLIHDPKKFWYYVNIKRKTTGFPSTMSYNDKSATGCEEICSLFADFFKTNYVSDSELELESDFDFSNQSSNSILSIGSLHLSEDVVMKALTEIDVKKGSGPDEISPLILKNCAKALCKPLTLLFNRSLETGVYPTKFKSAYILPIFKSGLRNQIINYRGVSSSPTIGKFFDYLVTTELTKQTRQYLSNSTATNLLNFSNFVINSMEKGCQVDTLYTDFQKAFDRVLLSILIPKLHLIGFHSNLLRWIYSFLKNRTQRVKMSGFLSDPFFVPSGVVQ